MEADGLSRSLAPFWKKMMEIEVLEDCQNFIHTCYREKDGGIFWESTFVHGNPVFRDRRLLWERIQSLQIQSNCSWMCIGDFNQILLCEEKIGL